MLTNPGDDVSLRKAGSIMSSGAAAALDLNGQINGKHFAGNFLNINTII